MQEVNNKSENLKSGIEDLAIAEQTGAINLVDTFRITAVLVPLLLAQPKATIMTVSSGIAFPLIQQLHAYGLLRDSFRPSQQIRILRTLKISQNSAVRCCSDRK